MPLAGAKKNSITGIRVPRQCGLPQNLLLDSGVLREDFEASGDWTTTNCTVADDAINYKVGAQAVKMTSSAAGFAKIDKTVSFNANGSQFVRVWIYPSVQRDISIFLAATAWSKYFQANITGTTLAVNAWNYWQIPHSSFGATGGMTWADTITKVRFQFSASAAGQECTWDGLYTNVYPKGALLLTFDDNNFSQFTEAFSYARQTGVRATCSIVTNNIGSANYLTAEQMQIMDAHGWDMANHTTDHTYLTTLSEADQETHIGDAKTALDALGLTRASMHLVYPNGLYNADTFTAMAATGTVTGRTIVEKNMILPLPYNYLLTSRNIINTTTLQTFKGLIKTAMDERTILSTYMHDIVANPSVANEWAIRDWRALCDYIAMSGIPTITISELYSLLSGPVTVPMPY